MGESLETVLMRPLCCFISNLTALVSRGKYVQTHFWRRRRVAGCCHFDLPRKRGEKEPHHVYPYPYHTWTGMFIRTCMYVDLRRQTQHKLSYISHTHTDLIQLHMCRLPCENERIKIKPTGLSPATVA